MAEVRKGKSENHIKARTRTVAAATAAASSRKRSPTPTRTVERPKSELEIRRLLAETQDQLSLIHGVLEELCERQEAMAAWQMEFSKKLVSLQEAQWRSLEDIAGVDMGRPVEKAFGIRLDQFDPETEDNHLDEANKMLDEVNHQSMPKRAERMRKRRDPLRPRTESTTADQEDFALEERPKQDAAVDSVFVVPAKVDVH